MRRALLLSAVLAMTLTGCGSADDADREQGDEDGVMVFVAELFSTPSAQACTLLTQPADGDRCAAFRRVHASLRKYATNPTPVVDPGPQEIIDRRVTFNGDDKATLIICYGDGDPCVSDLGAEELTLERVGDRWRVAGTKNHTEDF